jgi:hypothetical protein
VWYLPPPRVLGHFVEREQSPTGWGQMQNTDLQMESGWFRARFIRASSNSHCSIHVYGRQQYNGYENTEEALRNVPLDRVRVRPA